MNDGTEAMSIADPQAPLPAQNGSSAPPDVTAEAPARTRRAKAPRKMRKARAPRAAKPETPPEPEPAPEPAAKSEDPQPSERRVDSSAQQAAVQIKHEIDRNGRMFARERALERAMQFYSQGLLEVEPDKITVAAQAFYEFLRVE